MEKHSSIELVGSFQRVRDLIFEKKSRVRETLEDIQTLKDNAFVPPSTVDIVNLKYRIVFLKS